jgi:Glyoxalase-like domain
LRRGAPGRFRGSSSALGELGPQRGHQPMSRETATRRRWLGRASMVDRWRRSSRSKSPSTAQNLSASLVSGVRCWGTSYRRHRRGLLRGTISIARRRLSIRVQRSHALIPQVWARDCSSNAFPNARSSTIGCILTCASAPGSWVKSAWPHLRAECARLVALGAVRVRLLPADGDDESCLVMQDIGGNEFCLD